MGADQVAEISPLLREVVEDHEASPSDPSTELCATLEIDGQPNAWLQFVVGTLNFAYPSQEAPEVLLASVLAPLPEWQVASWEPEKFATVAFGPVAARLLAKVVDGLLTQLFSLGDYSVNGTLERIPRNAA